MLTASQAVLPSLPVLYHLRNRNSGHLCLGGVGYLGEIGAGHIGSLLRVFMLCSNANYVGG